MVMKLKKTVCGLSLKDGSLAIAFIFIIGMGCGLVGHISYLKGRLYNLSLTEKECFFLYLEISILVLLLTFNLLLVIGVVAENRGVLVCWITAHILYMFYLMAKFTFAFYTAVVTVDFFYCMGVFVFYFSLIWIILYSIMVVSSYLSQIKSARRCKCKEEKRRLLKTNENDDFSSSQGRKAREKSSAKPKSHPTPNSESKPPPTHDATPPTSGVSTEHIQSDKSSSFVQIYKNQHSCKQSTILAQALILCKASPTSSSHTLPTSPLLRHSPPLPPPLTYRDSPPEMPWRTSLPMEKDSQPTMFPSRPMSKIKSTTNTASDSGRVAPPMPVRQQNEPVDAPGPPRAHPKEVETAMKSSRGRETATSDGVPPALGLPPMRPMIAHVTPLPEPQKITPPRRWHTRPERLALRKGSPR